MSSNSGYWITSCTQVMQQTLTAVLKVPFTLLIQEVLSKVFIKLHFNDLKEVEDTSVRKFLLKISKRFLKVSLRETFSLNPLFGRLTLIEKEGNVARGERSLRGAKELEGG